MALSATFTANFSSFYDAVDKADAKLKDFGDGADKVGGRLNTLGNQFSGRKIIQDATLMAKAVEEIGGVSALTDKELARLGSTANEAVAKMQKLGMEVPKNLQEIADKTQDANTKTGDWLGSITKIAGAVGIAFSVGAIKDFVGSVFDAAGAVKDLSDQWGVSTQFVQQWSAAAQQSGVEQEQLGKSIQYVTEKLSESSPEYEAMLQNIGLSTKALRGMSTEDAYKQIVTAIGGITDETKQLDIAMGILGPNAKKIIGGIRDGMYDAAGAQKFMSDETIKRLEAAGDAWARLKNNVIIYTGEMLASTMSMHERATSSWKNFFGYVSAFAAGGAGGVAAFDKQLAATEKTTKAVVTTTETYAVAGQHLESGLKTTAEVLAGVKKKEEDLKAAQDARAATQAELKKKQDAYNKSLADHKKAVDDLIDAFAGNDLVVKANLYLEALQQSIPVQQMTRAEQDAINKVMKDAIGTYDAAGTDAPQAMYDIWAATLKADEATAQYDEDLSKLMDTFTNKLTGKVDLAKGLSIGAAPPPGTFDNLAKGLTAALSDSVLKAIQGGGSIFQAAGSAVGNYILDPKQSGVGKAIEKSASKLPGLIGTAISSAIPLVGSFIGPAIGWLSNKISGWFGKKEYEKLRDGFVQSAGGINELTKAAESAGISLDALFHAKKTDQVQAAIKTIQDALASDDMRKAFIATEGGFDALTHAAETAGVSVDALFAARTSDQVTAAIGEIQAALKFQEDAYQLAIDTAQKYGFTLEELGPAMARQELDKQAQQLYKDWEVLNSAGIDTIAIADKMSASVSEYVQHALKMGTEVPEAMRPMLEAMAKSGDLLDANGNAITDLDAAGVSFALSMSDGFKALIDQVSKLTDAISRSLGLAIKNVPDVKVKGTVTWDVPPMPTSGAGQGMESYATGTEGFRNFGTGTPVMLHGWEAVVPREDASSGAFATVSAPVAASTTAAALAPSIVINAQGAFFDTPGDLQRLADRVNDALTAKFGMQNTMRAG